MADWLMVSGVRIGHNPSTDLSWGEVEAVCPVQPWNLSALIHWPQAFGQITQSCKCSFPDLLLEGKQLPLHTAHVRLSQVTQG